MEALRRPRHTGQQSASVGAAGAAPTPDYWTDTQKTTLHRHRTKPGGRYETQVGTI